MSVLRCKMCGAVLPQSKDSVVECEYCRTKQTLPRMADEKCRELFDRANSYRQQKDFDSAASVYNDIIGEFPNEPEAYWGLCLCRYGIEYIVDPKSGRRIPTCHRTQFKSILDSSDYKSAIEKADAEARRVYESEARVIDGIQKGILEISSKEDPFDVFICYKETDDMGRRTQDSVIAQKIYDELTRDGLRVFFARITLEDKLGEKYEPYIFAALNSSRVMLVVGTKPEHFNAVWVKNEWSRFLELAATDPKKKIYPCYYEMSPYALPHEFKGLQSQDCDKIGFEQDLLRGIRKIVPKLGNTGGQEKSRITSVRASESEALIRRGEIFLEGEEWDSAIKCFDNALDKSPEEARAYIGKVCAKFNKKNISGLASVDAYLEDEEDFKRACQFGNSEMRSQLSNISQLSKKRYDDRLRRRFKWAMENKRWSDAWDCANTILNKYPKDPESYLNVLFAGFHRTEYELIDKGDSLYGMKEITGDEYYIKGRKLADADPVARQRYDDLERKLREREEKAVDDWQLNRKRRKPLRLIGRILMIASYLFFAYNFASCIGALPGIDGVTSTWIGTSFTSFLKGIKWTPLCTIAVFAVGAFISLGESHMASGSECVEDFIKQRYGKQHKAKRTIGTVIMVISCLVFFFAPGGMIQRGIDFETIFTYDAVDFILVFGPVFLFGIGLAIWGSGLESGEKGVK